MRALYITPMKSPESSVPSGDRTIARATEKILRQAGLDVVRSADCVTFLPVPDEAGMQRVQMQADEAIARAITMERPDLVFTYHCYYKAPDLVGPAVARHFGIPAIIAEASYGARHAHDAWAPWHQKAEQALRAASLILVTSQNDRDGLSGCVNAARLVDWPPFIDEAIWPILPRWTHRDQVHLLSVAMMREGDKFESYRLLADALARLPRDDWRLTLVGDGPTRDAVLGLFAQFGTRVVWRGALQGLALADAYADADLLVWPAVNEALGMVFLEAALQSCPSLAGDEGGVAQIVRDGITGRLVPPRDAAAFAGALDALISDRAQLATLGAGAQAMAQSASIDAAAARLRDALTVIGVAA